MAVKKSVAVRLAPGKPKQGVAKSAPPDPEDFIGNIMSHPDVGEAMNIVGEFTGVVFDHDYGAEITALEQDQIEWDARYKDSCEDRVALEKSVQGTPQYKKSAPERSGTDNVKVSVFDWRGRDLIAASLALLMALAALVLGWSNVFANLIANNPTFIERPWLAASLAMLLPIGATGLKFVTNFIQLDVWRRRYCLLIYTLLFSLLLTWGVLFGLNFNGAAGGMNWEALGEANDSATALVYVQLLCEMIGATALYLAFEEIAGRYSPDSWIKNAEYFEATTALKAHLANHDKLRDQRNKAHGRLASLRALREKKINEAVAHYLALRAASHPKFGQ